MNIHAQTGLDELDLKILAFLQRDGRTPYTQMAKALSVSEGTIRKRVKRLEDENYIKIIGVADPFRIGLDTMVFIWIKVERGELGDAMAKLVRLKQTRYVAYATGAFDLVAMAVVQSRQGLLRFLNEELGEISGIRETDTSVILGIRKQAYDWISLRDGEELGVQRSKPQPDWNKPEVVNLDRIDKRILTRLQEDGRYRYQDIADELGVAERTVRRRVETLIESGVLQIVGVTDPFKVGMNSIALVGAKVKRQHIDEIVDQLSRCTQVRYVGLSTGSYDLIIEVVMESNQELGDFLIDELTCVNGIIHTDTSLILRICKESYAWNVEQ